MAAHDIPLEPVQIGFSNELLSSSELLQNKGRNHKIPVKGPKEFIPNESLTQKTSLQKTLDEHWMLLTEERVERIGNLVNAEWIPKEKIVKLQAPAGKFWQTMGFSDKGKQYLFPEEALYLMECGNVQVFYQDLPLSIQEGYESFLSAETVTLIQYQVFSHLKRLGYVVNRFDKRLLVDNNKPSKQLKRKWSRSSSFRLCNKKSAASPEVSAGQHKGEIRTSLQNSSLDAPDQLKPQKVFEDKTLNSDLELEQAPHRDWWTSISSQPEQDSFQPSQRDWKFNCVVFPDLGSYSDNCTYLPSPDPSLLPGALQVKECNMMYWHQRINLKKEHRYKRKWQRERSRPRHNINADQEVRECKNWVEYLELVEKRRREQHNQRPTQLGEQEVMPLAQPGKCSSHRELLEQVNIIQSCDFLGGNTTLPDSDQWEISFDVYQPDTDFRKSCPGKPYTRLCVCSFDGLVPNLLVLQQLSFQSGDVPVTLAVVDHGDISFYCFKEFKLPTDVY